MFALCYILLREAILHPEKGQFPARPVLLWLGVIACLLGTARYSAAAKPTTLALSEYQKQDWQIEDGLPENNVRMIAQRSDGTLLIATSSGICSFDGVHFQSLPLDLSGISDNEAVNAILPTGNDDLWIGTDGRGVLHRTAAGTVAISERAGFTNERIRTLYQDRSGVLWIATQNGVERYDGHRLESIAGKGMISGDITTAFAEDGHNGMFFLTSSGLFRWSHGVAEPFPLHLQRDDHPVAVYRDPQQRIWLGTMSQLFELVPSGASDTFLPVARGKVTSPVTSLLGDAAGQLWIGTRGAGIWRLGEDGLSHWSTHNGLPDEAIRSLYLDDEHNLWIGMLTGGLSRWRKGALAPYGEPEGFSASYAANVLADSHGDLWLGTWGAGLFRRHEGRLLPATPPGLPISTPIRTLAEDRKGQIWIGTWFDGVYRFDGREYHHYLLGNESPGNAVSAMLPSDGLWVGTYTGLFYFPTGEPDPVKRKHLLDSHLITCIAEDRDGSILVGTSNGLFRVRDRQASPISGLPNVYVLALAVDSKGYAWVSTKAGGLALVRQGTITPVPAASGFPSYAVSSATEDGNGHLWLGTSRGIVRLSVEDLHQVVDFHQATLPVVILGKADGMRSSECGGPSKPGSAILPDGTLWFATTKGFVHTTDVAEKLGSASPAASVVGWTLSNDPGDAAVNPYAAGTTLDLEAGEPSVLFLFNAKLLSNPGHLEFRYRLRGYDSDWTSTRMHIARYRHLPPGQYTFEVQAHVSGEEWTSPAAVVPLKQSPYLYQTWYFYLTLAVGITLLALYLFRRRVETLKGRIGIVLEERNRISRECHDTLMAGFAAISWQLEATSKLFRDGDGALTPAAQSCELARSMVSHCQAEARRIIWDLRDADEVTSTLSEAIRRTLSANPPSEQIEITFDVEGEEIPLAPGCVHHLLCIGQEAVSNSLRHGDPAHVILRLRYEADSVVLSIRDDGCGFRTRDDSRVLATSSSGTRTGHFGIPVMEERARKLGGTFRLQSSAGLGTEITVRVGFNAMQTGSQEHHIIRWLGI